MISRRSFVAVGAVGAAGLPLGIARGEVLPKSVSFSVAEAVSRLGSGIPPDVRETMIWTLIDNMAVMSYGAKFANAPLIRSLESRSGGPEALVLGMGLKLPVELAAAAGAFALHAAEIDDSDLRAQLRASSVIMSTALAVAQAVESSGKDFLQAAALGYTLQGRLAAPLGAIQSSGWMASGVWGPPAAAAMAARQMRLPIEATASAIGLAGSASGGAFQYYYDQTDEKRIIVARAARTAVESAVLARTGEIGPPRILEGQAGLYRLFGGASALIPSAESLTQDLDQLEGPLFIIPKFYAASHSIIPTLEGMAIDLPTNLRGIDVERFIVRASAAWGRVVGEKINDFKPPASQIGAALNFSFVVATFLTLKSVLPNDFPDAMRNTAILDLAARGRFEAVPGPADPSIELQMKDGRRLIATARVPGLNDRAPLDRERRMNKFSVLTRDRLGVAKANRLLDLCRSIETFPSMRVWAERAQENMK